MDILVLGGSGFVGGHLARRLARDGHRLRIATRYAPGARRLAVLPSVRIRSFDPYDAGRLAAELEDCDALINLIGHDCRNDRGRDASAYRRAHVDLVETAIDACRRAGVTRFVQLSVLGAGDSQRDVYLQTRGVGDALLCDSGLDWTLLRSSIAFGPDDRFLSRFSAWLKWLPVLPLARNDAVASPVFVADVAEAFARVLQQRSSVRQTYELRGPERWTLRAVAQFVAAQRGMKRWIIGLPGRLGRLPGMGYAVHRFVSEDASGARGEDGFARLGMAPWSLSDKAPEWLRPSARQARYRRFRQVAGRARDSQQP